MDFSSITITELAAIMAAHLTKWDIDVVLVGGLAVEIYTENLYLTKDIDMVNTNYRTPSRLQKAMVRGTRTGTHLVARSLTGESIVCLRLPPIQRFTVQRKSPRVDSFTPENSEFGLQLDLRN